MKRKAPFRPARDDAGENCAPQITGSRAHVQSAPSRVLMTEGASREERAAKSREHKNGRYQLPAHYFSRECQRYHDGSVEAVSDAVIVCIAGETASAYLEEERIPSVKPISYEDVREMFFQTRTQSPCMFPCGMSV